MRRIKSENVYFILVEPEHPGNIGASARAIKTMGFRHLWLVSPHNHQSPEVQWMAHASQDILENMKVFNNLSEALKSMHFVIATTQRTREYHLSYYTPEELAEKIAPITQDYSVAVVFGRESSGLTNEEIQMCHCISTIPAAIKHPSLNLAQAVMIYAYEFFKYTSGEEKRYHWKIASFEEVQSVYHHLRQSMENIGFQPIDNWENFLMRFKRLFGRAVPEKRDVRLMHKILQSFDEYIDQLRQKQGKPSK